MSETDRTPKRVGIVGLGLIGGSFAKAYADAGIEVFAADIDERAMNAAMAEETVAGPLDEATIPTCELLILAVYPQAIIEWVRSHEQFISPSTLVIDCGSVKRSVCPVCFSIAERCDFTFIGGHPMAGLQYSGYRHARADLYAGQPMVARAARGFMTPILFCGPRKPCRLRRSGRSRLPPRQSTTKLSRTPRSSPMW